MCKKIIILGYMCSGKSTVGSILANKLGYNFIDLDDFIQKNEQLSVKNIFDTYGEIHFRKLENKYLTQILNTQNNFVLALGGGTPCFGNNMQLIKNATPLTFFINVPASVLVPRLASFCIYRPIIANLMATNSDLLEFVNKHLFERNPYYFQSSHTIFAKDLPPEQIALLILSKLQEL